MEALGVATAIVVAIQGLVVNAFDARRQVRRDMRVDYLVKAYRNLDDASHRPLTPSTINAIERSIADIQLLGAVEQIQLADEFSRCFASSNGADLGPLLEEIRGDLRDELSLPALVPRRVWLRMEPSTVWTTAAAEVRKQLPPSEMLPGLLQSAGQASEHKEPTNHAEDVAVEFERLGEFLNDHFSLGLGSAIEAIEATLAENLVHERSKRGLEGLVLLAEMARRQPHRITHAEVGEYSMLVKGLILGVRLEERPNS